MAKRKDGGAGDFLKKPASEMRPFKKQPLRIGQPCDGQRDKDARMDFSAIGEPSWSGVTGNRPVMALPPEYGKGPIRARAERAAKGIDGYD